eukprot:TRINITY_DN8174_c0_g1_i1.p1 TRINITY_DN8174_c0_g1~~TRINITY_DN8174_c0_g1_i1.p1  ORF type:complete len:150 (-),score=23.66 TRINITY_DN8174_c0_g1_i1:32-481(-)
MISAVGRLVSHLERPLSSHLLLQYERSFCQAPQKPTKTLLDRLLSTDTKPHPKFTAGWWGEAVLICTVFAITGSSTLYFVRPVIKNVLHLEGSLKDGPWSYRLGYVTTITPVYSVLLVFFGTVFGRHLFFRRMSVRIWSRFIPPLKKYL